MRCEKVADRDRQLRFTDFPSSVERIADEVGGELLVAFDYAELASVNRAILLDKVVIPTIFKTINNTDPARYRSDNQCDFDLFAAIMKAIIRHLKDRSVTAEVMEAIRSHIADAVVLYSQQPEAERKRRK